MTERELEQMRDLAVRLAQEAGRLAVAKFESHVIFTPKGSNADVVTHVDQEAERRILAGIRDAFPDHAMLGEESGRYGDDDADIQWLVDPLDGTNNYVMGLPLFGVCLTACRGSEPVVAVVHDSIRDITTSAVRGRGTHRGERRLTIEEASPLDRTTVSWTQGYAVHYDDPFRLHAVAAIERTARRVLRTWSPSIDWGLIAAGGIGALVAYRNEPWDLVGGALIVQEAGGVIYRAHDRDCLIAGQAGVVRELQSLLDG